MRDEQGRFAPGHKACGHVLTRADRKRGYKAALAKAMAHSPDRYAWFWRQVRGWYGAHNDAEAFKEKIRQAQKRRKSK